MFKHIKQTALITAIALGALGQNDGHIVQMIYHVRLCQWKELNDITS